MEQRQLGRDSQTILITQLQPLNIKLYRLFVMVAGQFPFLPVADMQGVGQGDGCPSNYFRLARCDISTKVCDQ